MNTTTWFLLATTLFVTGYCATESKGDEDMRSEHLYYKSLDAVTQKCVAAATALLQQPSGTYTEKSGPSYNAKILRIPNEHLCRIIHELCQHVLSPVSYDGVCYASHFYLPVQYSLNSGFNTTDRNPCIILPLDTSGVPYSTENIRRSFTSAVAALRKNWIQAQPGDHQAILCKQDADAYYLFTKKKTTKTQPSLMRSLIRLAGLNSPHDSITATCHDLWDRPEFNRGNMMYLWVKKDMIETFQAFFRLDITLLPVELSAERPASTTLRRRSSAASPSDPDLDPARLTPSPSHKLKED